MKIYTIGDGTVENGAKIEKFHLKKIEVEIPAILVGEEGRGRALGVLPVELLPENFQKFSRGEETIVKYGRLGQTKNGRPKLFEDASENSEAAIIVFRTPIGFRGHNSHTGDYALCEKCGGTGKVPGTSYADCDVCDDGMVFQPFPGQVIVSGIIAQGLAGRMGEGEQIIAIIPYEAVFCQHIHGRRYGAPHHYFYKITKEKILGGVTRTERETTDLF